MEVSEFNLCMSVLNEIGLAKSPELGPDKMMIWYMFFRKHQYEDLIESILYYSSRNKFYPTIADLLENIKNIRDYKEIIPVSNAWERFMSGDQDNRLYKTASQVGISYYGVKNHPEDNNTPELKERFINIYREILSSEMNKNKKFGEIREVIEVFKIENRNIKRIEDNRRNNEKW